MRTVGAFAAVLTALITVPVLAAEPPGSETGEVSLAPLAQEGKGEWLPDGETVREGIQAALREQAERRRELLEPSAVEERAKSLDAYSSLGAGASEALLRSTFADQLAAVDADPARRMSRADFVRPLGATAVTIIEDGEGMLVDAGFPVKAENESGRMEPVDLGLEGTAGGLETTNGLSDVVVGGSAAEPIEVGGKGIEISQVGIREESATRRFGDLDAFQFETSTDTDTLISPISGGVEIFNLLRSEKSPETFRFKVEVPTDSLLRPDGRGGAVVARAEDTLGRVRTPVAVDAQGTEVPVGLAIEGDALVLTVRHRGAGYAMPILLDPLFEDWSNVGQNWQGGANLDALEPNGPWKWTSEPYGLIYFGTSCFYACWGRGLYLSAPARNYGANVHSHWTYSAPPYSYVQDPYIPLVTRQDHGCVGYTQPHDYFGFVDDFGNWKPGSPWPNKAPGGGFSMPGWGRAFIFGMSSGNGVNIPCWRDAYVGGIAINLGDWFAPAISAPAGVPARWIGTSSISIGVSSSDEGLGVARVKLLADGKGIIGEDTVGYCTGLWKARCPNGRSSQFNLTGASFAEGVRDASVVAIDPTGKIAERHFETKVDRSKPVVALEGQLARVTEADEGEAKAAEDIEKLRLPVYNLTIKATDEGTESDPQQSKRSGVENIEVWLDGNPMQVPWEPTPSCDASCPKEGTYTLRLSELTTAGVHRLEVRAVDFAENEKVRDIEFEYFPATGIKDEYLMHRFPLPDGQSEAEGQRRRPELAVNVMNGNLVYRQVDVDVESSAALDLKLERYYNSMLPDSENTEWGDGWTLAETPDLKPISSFALATAATMAASPSGAERYFSLWLDMPTPAGPRSGYELNFKYVSANTYDVTLSKWQAGTQTQLATKTGLSFAVGNSLALVDEGATVSAWTDTGSGFVQRLSVADSAFDQGKTGIFGAGNITRISKFKAGVLSLAPGIGAALAAMPVIEVFDGSATSNTRFASEWSALGWAGGGTPKGGTTSAGWRPVDAFASGANGAFYNQNVAASGGGASQAELVDSSGALESGVVLPKVEGEGRFDPALQATFKKRTGGGYLMTDETGESASAVAFDETGQTEALLSGGDVKVDYDYEDGSLSEIAVQDPGTVQLDPSEVESSEPQATEGTPLFDSAFGSVGAGDSQFNTPTDVAIGPEGDLWVADYGNNRIQHFNPAGEYAGQFGSQGSAAGKLNNPASIAIDSEGNLWVADKGNSRLQKFSPEGALLDQSGSLGSGNGQFSRPEGIAIDASGDIWVSDTYNYRVQKLSPQGDFIEVVAPSGLGSIEPTGIDAGPGGRVWVTDWSNNRVVALSEDGDFELSFGSAGSGQGQFNRPDAVEADENGNVWVGDQGNGRIQRFDEEGSFVDQFGAAGSGPGQFSFGYPFGFAVGQDRRVWIADRNNNRVQRWDPPFEAGEGTVPEDDDPSVEIETDGRLVEAVSGDESGVIDYEHQGELLTAVDGPDGETEYEYDETNRLTKVTLANATYGEVAYFADGRVESVTIAPGGTDSKTTFFAYTDAPERRTFVEPPDEPNVTYDIGDDGSVLKWRNTAKPPELNLSGTLYDYREEDGALVAGDHELQVQAEDEEGVESVEIIVGGILVDELSCKQVPGPPIECTKPEALPWVMETEVNPPGHIQVEAIATNSKGESSSERFWVDVPEPAPPPAPGAPVAPRFGEIKKFRSEYGLEVNFPVASQIELNERIFNLIKAWHEPSTPAGQVARASWERWGVPLRAEDVAEMEYREWFLATNGAILDSWFESVQPAVYAGYHIDHEAGGIFRIGFTSNQEVATPALKDALSLVAKERVQPFVTEPAYDWKTLNDAEDTLIESLPANAGLDSAMSDIRLDARDNRVRLFTQNVPAAESAVDSVLGSGHPVSFQYSASVLEATSGRTRVQGRMLAGDHIFPLLVGRCTAGFGTYKLGKKQPNGSRPEVDYVLTAGHCSRLDGESYYRSADRDQRFGEVRIDPWTNGPNFGTDAEAIRLNNPNIVPKAVYTGGPRNWGVQPAVQSFVGDLVYFSGGTTGSPNPRGEVIGRSKGAVRNDEGRRSGGYWVEFKRGAAPGDSGAPVFRSDGSAIGLVTGTWDNPDGRHLTLVTPLLHPPNMRKGLVPGILHHAAMAPMYLRKGPGP